MSITLKSNIAFAGDPASLPYAQAPLPRGAQYYLDFVDPVSVVKDRGVSRLAGNAATLAADAAVLRSKGGGYARVEANALDRFRWSMDGTRNLGLSMAHDLDRNTVLWDAAQLTTTAAAIAVAEAGDDYNRWYGLTGDGTNDLHGATWTYATSAAGPRLILVEVARPATNATPYVRLRLAGSMAYGVYDITAGICRAGGGGAASLYATPRGYLLALYVANGAKDGSAALSLVGDYEAATEANTEALSTSVMFRAFKVQGYVNTTTAVSLADWLPKAASVSATAPTLTLLATTIATGQPFTLLARLRTNLSPHQTVAGLASVGPIHVRWGSSDTRLFVLNGTTVLGYIDHPYTPDTVLHLVHRYDGTNLTISLAVGEVAAGLMFKSFQTAVALTGASTVVYGNTANAFGGQLQKLVGWQSVISDSDLRSFMSGVAY